MAYPVSYLYLYRLAFGRYEYNYIPQTRSSELLPFFLELTLDLILLNDMQSDKLGSKSVH